MFFHLKSLAAGSDTCTTASQGGAFRECESSSGSNGRGREREAGASEGFSGP
jgi:hypothetical protein